MRVSLGQIAKQAGCSRATVSYALNNSRQVSDETRERIQKLAREMGWRPNPELVRQMQITRRTRSNLSLPPLGIIVGLTVEELSRQGAVRCFLESAVAHAEHLGFSVNVLNVATENLTPKRMKGILDSRGVEGVVYIGAVVPEFPKEYFEVGNDYACAVAGYASAPVPYHCCMADLFAGGVLTIQRLHALGFGRPVALIPADVDRMLRRGVEAGITVGLQDFDLFKEGAVRRVSLEESSYTALEDELLEQRPDALLGLDVRQCQSLQQRLSQKGLEVPLYSLDLMPDQEVAGGLDLLHQQVGRGTVDLVVNQLNACEHGVPPTQFSLNVEPVWRDRAENERDLPPQTTA